MVGLVVRFQSVDAHVAVGIDAAYYLVLVSSSRPRNRDYPGDGQDRPPLITAATLAGISGPWIPESFV
jgi:hypothetical protein